MLIALMVLLSLIVVAQPRLYGAAAGIVFTFALLVIPSYSIMLKYDGETTETAFNAAVYLSLKVAVYLSTLLLLKLACSLTARRVSIMARLYAYESGVSTASLPTEPPALMRKANAVSIALANSVTDGKLLNRDVFSVFMLGCIDEDTVSHMREELGEALESDSAVVRVSINSGGGDIDAACQVRYMIQELAQQKQVELMVLGSCYSAAMFVFTCLPLANRSAKPLAMFMTHTVSGGGGYKCTSNALRNRQLVETFVSETDIDEASLKKLYDSRMDYFFDAQKAIELGIVGHVL